MKKLITTAMLWALIGMSFMSAQLDAPYKIDTLQIVEQNIIIAQVVAPNIYTVKKEGNWSMLLESFQKQMRLVKDQIPEYTQYDIHFLKGQKLSIEENLAAEKTIQYDIRSGNVIRSPIQSLAILVDETMEIHLHFNELEELYTRNYGASIANAFEKMKKRPFLIGAVKDVYFPKDRVVYNNSSAEIMKKKFGKPKFSIFVDGTVGIHRNLPVFNFNSGIGFSFGQYQEKSIYLATSNLYQYDSEVNEGLFTSLLGGVFKPSEQLGVGFFVGDNRREESTTFDVKNRWSIIYYPKFGGNFTVNFNRSLNGSLYLGVDIGIPLQ